MKLDDPPTESAYSCEHATSETPIGTCPFQEDVNGDSEPNCRCCVDCAQQCAEDI